MCKHYAFPQHGLDESKRRLNWTNSQLDNLPGKGPFTRGMLGTSLITRKNILNPVERNAGNVF